MACSPDFILIFSRGNYCQVVLVLYKTFNEFVMQHLNRNKLSWFVSQVYILIEIRHKTTDENNNYWDFIIKFAWVSSTYLLLIYIKRHTVTYSQGFSQFYLIEKN